MEPLPLVYSFKTSWNYLLLAVSVSLFCVGLAFWSPISLAWMLGAIFWAFLFASRTFRWVVFPAVLAFNQMLYARWGVPIVYGNLIILPSDWMALLLLVAVLLNKALKGEKLIERTGIEKPMAIFLGAVIVVSLFGTVSINAAAIGIGHIILYFLTFYAMVADWRDVPARNLWRTFQFWAIPVAVSIAWGFLSSGGGRSLGISRSFRFFELILPVICFQLVSLTLKGGIGRLLLLGLFILAVVGSQTRAVWIGVGIVTITWFLIRSFSTDNSLKKRIVQIGTAYLKAAILLVIILLLLAPFLSSVEKRTEEIATGKGTIFLRFFLWGIALKFFLNHPLAGIGLWQFPHAVAGLQEVRNIPVYVYQLQGLSTHNAFLEILCETGIIGTFAFLIFCVAILSGAWKTAQRAQTLDEMYLGWGIFLTLFYFITGNFYMETWIAYSFMYFLALSAIYGQQLDR